MRAHFSRPFFAPLQRLARMDKLLTRDKAADSRRDTYVNSAVVRGAVRSVPRLLFGLAVGVFALNVTARAQATEDMEVLHVRPNFYMIAGAGGNIGVQIGADGVLLVDAGSAGTSARVLAEIRKLTDKPIHYIVNTSADADHAGGNADLAKAGQTIFPVESGGRSDFMKAMTGGAASVLAHENVLLRMSAPTGKTSPFSSDAWPTRRIIPATETFTLITKELKSCISRRHTPTATAPYSFAFRTW